VNPLWNEERVERREQFERVDFGEVNERSCVRDSRKRHAFRPQSTASSDDLPLSVRSLRCLPTNTFDCFLAVEFAAEVPRENEVFLQVFETAFESSFEHLGFGKAASLSDFSNPVGNFGGRTVRLLGNVHQSVSARPTRI
jgi:hypothetical protein